LVHAVAVEVNYVVRLAVFFGFTQHLTQTLEGRWAQDMKAEHFVTAGAQALDQAASDRAKRYVFSAARATDHQ
jgi:hypothetical protein